MRLFKKEEKYFRNLKKVLIFLGKSVKRECNLKLELTFFLEEKLLQKFQHFKFLIWNLGRNLESKKTPSFSLALDSVGKLI